MEDTPNHYTVLPLQGLISGLKKHKHHILLPADALVREPGWCLRQGVPWRDGSVAPLLTKASMEEPIPTLTAGIVSAACHTSSLCCFGRGQQLLFHCNHPLPNVQLARCKQHFFTEEEESAFPSSAFAIVFTERVLVSIKLPHSCSGGFLIYPEQQIHWYHWHWKAFSPYTSREVN